MINLLIIDKNLKTAINLINLLSENSHDIKVTYVTDNLSDGINILNTNIIDITVIHTDEKIELISNALHKINDLYYEKYKKSIILIAENICNDFSNHYIYENFNSFKNISVILSEINELAKNKLSQSLAEQVQSKYEFIFRTKILDFYRGIKISLWYIFLEYCFSID